MTLETIQVDASLVNPNDTTEVNVVAAVAAVGNTHRLATGQIIKWTPEWLRAHAGDFIGKPVNVRLDSRGKATGHSRDPIGAIKESFYDEDKQAIMVTASLWEHYRPETIKELRKLFKNEELKVSMEFKYPEGSLQANGDGSHSPTAGTFSGMGFVGQAGDPRSMVYLMAALEKDEQSKQENVVSDVIKEIGARLASAFKTEPDQPEEPEFNAEAQDVKNAELSAAHEGSYEWLGRALQEHLSAGQSPDQPAYHYIIATYPNYAIYQEGTDYFRIDYKRSGDKLNFGEPQEVDPVYQPTAKASAEASGEVPADNTGNLIQGEENTMSATPEELLAAKDEQIAELKATLDAVNIAVGEMRAAQAAREAADAAKTLADERLAELEKITPVKEEAKAALHESLSKIDEPAYEAVKAAFAASAEVRAGIAPTDAITNPNEPGSKNEQHVPEADMEAFRAEAQAQFGSGLQSEDK